MNERKKERNTQQLTKHKERTKYINKEREKYLTQVRKNYRNNKINK